MVPLPEGVRLFPAYMREEGLAPSSRYKGFVDRLLTETLGDLTDED